MTGIWVYFVLLIFEGALRKWVFPGLATPLLIVRDPVAIWLLYKSLKSGVFRPNGYVIGMWIISLVAFIMALLVGHGSLVVAVYGLRITLFHFPLIFVISKVMRQKDLIRMGYWLLWLSVGMTVLLAVQFYSPQSAWVNRGIGGDTEGSGFSGAAGYFRVPGTFSFSNGLSNFYGLVTAYLFYFWLNRVRREIPRWLLIGATICLLAAIPLSISRGLFYQTIVSFIFVLAAVGRRPGFLGRLVVALTGGVVLVFILLNFSFFQTAVYAFTERFTSASTAEGGIEGTLLDRYLGGMIGAIVDTKAPFWGMGMGMGTNAGAKLLTGTTDFLIAEGEWGRLIGEMGLLLGLTAIGLRFSLVFSMARRSWQAVKKHDVLPWLLLSYAVLNVLQGQWAQPTALGFAMLSGGIVMAALRTSNARRS